MRTNQKNTPYRIVQVDEGWHVLRPKGTVPHAFAQLDDALAFVQRDSHGSAEIVEVVAGQVYMVKRLDRAA